MQENLIKDVVAHHLNSASMTVERVLRRAMFIRKARTVEELLRRTSPQSVRYEGGCNARMTRATPKIGLWLFSVKCREKWSKGPYDVRFKITKGQRLKDMNKREIKTSCNCNAWKYNGSDYNSLHGQYNERQYSEGQVPDTRDPHRINLICKHVAVCIPIFAKFIVPEEYKGFERRPPAAPAQRPAPRTPTPRTPTPRAPAPRTPTPRAPATRPTRQLRTPPRRV